MRARDAREIRRGIHYGRALIGAFGDGPGAILACRNLRSDLGKRAAYRTIVRTKR